MARHEINVVQLFMRFSEVIKMILEKGRKLLLEDEGRRQMLAKLLLARDLAELTPEQVKQLDGFKPLTDEEAIEWYAHQADRKYTMAQARRIVSEYRRWATKEGVPETTPLHYLVPAGFTLKGHAAKVGPCTQDFKYLQDWQFEDTATKPCLVSWIPRLAKGSIGMNVEEQKKLLADLRKQYELPEHHLTGFGSVALVAGLILAHFKATGEMVPFNNWTRTDTRRVGGHRLDLGWLGGRLVCSDCGWGENNGSDDFGVLASGVELGK